MTVAGLPMPVATTPTPVAATPPSNSSAAPATIAVDFMAMLGQLAGAAAPTPASTAMQAGANLPALKELKEETAEPESSDVLGLMPLSLPVMPVEVKANAAGTQATAMLAGLAKTQGSAVAPEAQLLTDLIQPEQLTPDTKPFEIPQLPTTSTETTSPLRQADAAYSRPVHVPVGSAAWADEIGSRMTMMVDQGKHTASLRLSPEHLGPLEIRIAVNDDKASVWFGAANADTRTAIENALPRLRELFASQGLSLADANVSREPPRQQPNPGAQTSSSGGFASEEGSVANTSVQVRLGLLDAYA
jgi:flagellar hook-length control protein FliK